MSVSLFFPVYKDEKTVRIVAEKALEFLKRISDEYEIVIVDDGSPDRSGQIALELQKEHRNITVIRHAENMGYGSAIRAGLKACRHDYICMIDGDDEYDVFDFEKLWKLKDFYDLIITFRYKKIYSNFRIFISSIYNAVLRVMFRSPFRDISTGLRMVRKSVIEEIGLESTSPFIGAEMAIKLMYKGYRVGEVGIQTFPRKIGRGSSVSFKNIIATIDDMRKIHKKIFSDEYDLPENRTR
jgi:glycosyltransferase involved in cell wall biosynthesis